MKLNSKRAILGGLVGTAVMTMMMYKGAPMMIGMKMDIAHRLSGMLGGNWMLGMAVHWINGVVVFPVIFVAFVAKFLPGKVLFRGVLWGIILWLIAQTVIMPMTGAGFFSSNIGPKVVMASLMGHIVYGALLGAISREEVSA